jgi:hypothetical protein
VWLASVDIVRAFVGLRYRGNTQQARVVSGPLIPGSLNWDVRVEVMGSSGALLSPLSQSL